MRGGRSGPSVIKTTATSALKGIAKARALGCSTSTATDDVLDPFEVWAETRLFADETFGGLCIGIVGYGADQRAGQADKAYYLTTVYADIEFTTQRGSPELRGDAS